MSYWVLENIRVDNLFLLFQKIYMDKSCLFMYDESMIIGR